MRVCSGCAAASVPRNVGGSGSGQVAAGALDKGTCMPGPQSAGANDCAANMHVYLGNTSKYVGSQVTPKDNCGGHVASLGGTGRGATIWGTSGWDARVEISERGTRGGMLDGRPKSDEFSLATSEAGDWGGNGANGVCSETDTDGADGEFAADGVVNVNGATNGPGME